MLIANLMWNNACHAPIWASEVRFQFELNCEFEFELNLNCSDDNDDDDGDDTIFDKKADSMLCIDI